MSNKTSEFQPAINAAVRKLERRLRPWAPMMADPHAFAAAYVAEDLLAEGWRPPLAPTPDWKRQRERPTAGPSEAYLEERRRMSGGGRAGGSDA
jgi:hypothetical protein